MTELLILPSGSGEPERAADAIFPSPPAPGAASTKVVCRPIGETDLEAVVTLLGRGFPDRPANYWRRGFERLARYGLTGVAGRPPFGVMLEHDGRAVGVILMLFTTAETPDGPRERCNLSSWYVDPAYRVHTATLARHALRRRNVTYTSISPAPHTLKMLEGIGFEPFSQGRMIALPCLKSGPRVRIRRVAAGIPFGSGEDRLLADHADMGCISLVVECDGADHPFVFLPYAVRVGPLSLRAQQLVYCRSLDDYVRFAGPIGRFLLRFGTALVLHDEVRRTPALPGLFRRQETPKYFRGCDRPRLGGLAYAERAIFGP